MNAPEVNVPEVNSAVAPERGVPLGSLVELVREAGEGGPFLGLEHVVPGRLYAPSRGAHGTGLRYRAGDVLFGRLRPVFRKVIFAREPGICSPELLVLRARGVAPEVLFYWMASDAMIQRALQVSQGTRMPRAPWAALADTWMRVPTEAEQQRVVSGLGAIDRRIDVHLQTIAALEQVITRQMQDAAGSLRLGDAARSHNDRSDTPVPTDAIEVGLKHLFGGTLALHRWETAPTLGESKQFDRGDLLFGALRPNLRKAVIAPGAGRCSPELLVLRTPDARSRAALIGAVVTGDLFIQGARLASGTRMPRVSFGALSGVHLRVPSDRAAELIVAAAERIAQASEAVATLGVLRDRLIPRFLP